MVWPQCENIFKSENGLKIHVGKAHKKAISSLATPDRLRQQVEESVSLSASPLLDASREEAGEEMEELVSSLGLCRNCNVQLRIRDDYECCERTKQLCEDCCYDLGVCNS